MKKNILILLLLWPIYVEAATRYVDGTLVSDCTSGDYSIASRNCTGSDGDAYDTIDEARDLSAAGDIVSVRSGTYTETVVGKSGTSGNVIEITNYGAEAPVIDGYIQINTVDYFKISGMIQENSVGSGTVVKNSNYITFEDVTLRNNTFHGAMVARDTTINTYITFDGCTVHGNSGSGIGVTPDGNIRNAEHITIQNCTIYGNGEDGIGVSNIDYCTITNNHVYSQVGEDGIDIKEDTSNCTVTYNTVHDNPESGIFVNIETGITDPPFNGGKNFIIRYNHIYGNGTDGFRAGSVASSDYFIVEHNIVEQNSTEDAMYMFRVIGATIANNTVIGGLRGLVGQCLRDSTIKDNIYIDSNTAALLFQGSSADCTGYLNGNITESNNNYQTDGTYIITWHTGTSYTSAQLDTFRSDTGEGSGTISADPLIKDTVSDDFNLAAGSPSINAASDGKDMGAFNQPVIDKIWYLGDEVTIFWDVEFSPVQNCDNTKFIVTDDAVGVNVDSCLDSTTSTILKLASSIGSGSSVLVSATYGAVEDSEAIGETGLNGKTRVFTDQPASSLGIGGVSIN
jgi:parallel beta-helix repeat protein